MMTPSEFEKGLTLTGVGLATAFVALGLLFLVIYLIYMGLRLFNRLAALKLQKNNAAIANGPVTNGTAEEPDNGGEGTIAVSARDPGGGPRKVKEMVAAVAAAVEMGRGRVGRRGPGPGLAPAHEGGAQATGERWRTFGRQEIMQGRRQRGGWRR